MQAVTRILLTVTGKQRTDIRRNRAGQCGAGEPWVAYEPRREQTCAGERVGLQNNLTETAQ